VWWESVLRAIYALRSLPNLHLASREHTTPKRVSGKEETVSRALRDLTVTTVESVTTSASSAQSVISATRRSKREGLWSAPLVLSETLLEEWITEFMTTSLETRLVTLLGSLTILLVAMSSAGIAQKEHSVLPPLLTPSLVKLVTCVLTALDNPTLAHPRPSVVPWVPSLTTVLLATSAPVTRLIFTPSVWMELTALKAQIEKYLAQLVTSVPEWLLTGIRLLDVSVVVEESTLALELNLANLVLKATSVLVSQLLPSQLPSLKAVKSVLRDSTAPRALTPKLLAPWVPSPIRKVLVTWTSARAALREVSTVMSEPLAAVSVRDLPSLSLLLSLASVLDLTESTWLMRELVSVRLASTLLMELKPTRMVSLIANAKSTRTVLPSRLEIQTVSAVIPTTALMSVMEVREPSLRTSVCASVLTSTLLTPSATRTAERSFLELLSLLEVKSAFSTQWPTQLWLQSK
jgi:hypothetical protein